jgi:Golgi nucleoside diphosphatase
MESLTSIPFSTFTTKEMLDNLNVKYLDKSLNDLDSAIYGGNFSEKTIESVNFLLSIANNFYQSERRKIKLANKKR